jgi:3-hydroxypropanoate dehydrogenase
VKVETSQQLWLDSEDYTMNLSTETLFTQARTANGYLPKPVTDAQLRDLYELFEWGPTSANCSPARVVFVRGDAAKAQLMACMPPANARKVNEAPITAIVGMDMEFYELLPRLFPHTDARSWFVGKPDAIYATAFRNSSLQGAYLMLAARAMGLHCGPMSGFDAAKVETAFFAGTAVRSNFICTLGYGDPAQVLPRSPRLAFDEACRLI